MLHVHHMSTSKGIFRKLISQVIPLNMNIPSVLSVPMLQLGDVNINKLIHTRVFLDKNQFIMRLLSKNQDAKPKSDSNLTQKTQTRLWWKL